MKKIFILTFFAAVVFAACSTVTSMVPAVSLPSSVPKAASPLTGSVDFRDGEVLCATGSNVYQVRFQAARVVTPQSAATKNQAEVIYVKDGKKEWVNYVMPSRKAAKTDMAIDKVLLVPSWFENRKEISAEDYRRAQWKLGRVTSVDELFKDIVEVAGSKYYWQVVRVPLQEP